MAVLPTHLPLPGPASGFGRVVLAGILLVAALIVAFPTGALSAPGTGHEHGPRGFAATPT